MRSFRAPLIALALTAVSASAARAYPLAGGQEIALPESLTPANTMRLVQLRWRPYSGCEAMITDALNQSGRFRLAERQAIGNVLQEQGFGASGRVAAPSAAGMGQIPGGGALGGFVGQNSRTPIGQAALASINEGVYGLAKQPDSKPASGPVVRAQGHEAFLNPGHLDGHAGADRVRIDDRRSVEEAEAGAPMTAARRSHSSTRHRA